MLYKKIVFDRDKDGLKYQHPERSCAYCKFNPCIEFYDDLGFKALNVDFAKYGCIEYEEI